MAIETPTQASNSLSDSPNESPQVDKFDVMHCREKFALLRDAFAVERDSRDFLSLHRVTADVLRPLLYMGSAANVELDCMLRNIGAEFIPNLIAEVEATPSYYPTGEKAWTEEFPFLEPRESMDNRFCAFHIIAIMIDSVPALAARLATDKGFQIGALRLMFNMYIRATNPLHVEDNRIHHLHIPSSSSEPKVWIPQWRTIVSCLVLLAAGYDGVDALKEGWREVSAETQTGAEKVKVKDAMISEILLREASSLQEKGSSALDDEEKRTLVEFSRLAVLISTPDDSSPAIVDHVRQELSTREWKIACGGCGLVQGSEAGMIKCETCKVLAYCSETCRQADWDRYHQDACQHQQA